MFFTGTADYTLDAPLTINSTLSNSSSNGFDANSFLVTFAGGIAQTVIGAGTNNFDDIDVTGSGTQVNVTGGDQRISGTLTLVGTAPGFNAGGFVTLVSSDDDPAVDGHIAQLDAPANLTGDFTVERYTSAEVGMVITTGIWRYISSPVSGLTVADWQNSFTISGDFDGSDNGTGSIPGFAIAS